MVPPICSHALPCNAAGKRTLTQVVATLPEACDCAQHTLPSQGPKQVQIWLHWGPIGRDRRSVKRIATVRTSRRAQRW
jgi:hypothetical protein